MSGSLTDVLLQSLAGNATNELGRQVGLDEQQTNSAVQVALPLLLAALGKNTEDADGAAALDKAVRKDHNSSLVEDVVGYLGSGGNKQEGAAILKHVLGSNREKAEQGISKMTGVDEKQAGAILDLLAPVVLSALSKEQQKDDLDAGGLSGRLQQERQKAESSPIGSLLNSLLDQNDDGNILDDLIRGAMRFFGRE